MRRFLILSITLICITFTNVSFAATPTATKESLEQQIATMNQQIAELDKQISQYQGQISQTQEEKNTLSARIRELSATRSKLQAQVKQTSSKIKLTGAVIQNLSADINQKNQNIDVTKTAMKKALYDLYQQDNTSVTEHLLTLDTFSDVAKEYNNRISLANNINHFIGNVKSAVVVVEKAKEQKEEEKAKLTKLQNDLTLSQKAVEISKAEKDKLLKATKNKESEYQRLLAESQKKRDAFEKEIRDYESQIKFILNNKLLPNIGSAPLAWPLDSVLITQLFGKTTASKRLYTSGSHSGVDFRASVGTPVKAMGTGTVLGVGDTDQYCKGASFGKWVFIEYNNGLSSTFGHLSSIQAKAGDKVVAGDVVGLSGNTGHSTGPHLHVTVYASDGASVQTKPSISCSGKTFIMPLAATAAYLDPMLYFPKPTKSMMKSGSGTD